jgi:hypothetical protein
VPRRESKTPEDTASELFFGPIGAPEQAPDARTPSANPATAGHLDARLDATDWLADLDDLERD